jgi:hypothetical protein
MLQSALPGKAGVPQEKLARKDLATVPATV